MKPQKNKQVNGNALPAKRGLFVGFFVAVLLSTGCKKELPQPGGLAAHEESLALAQFGTLNTSSSTTYEAEQATLSGAVVATNQPGYTGTGFVDYVNATGDFIEWTVSAATAGSFSLEFRYANGGSVNRPLELRVNGVVVSASLAFSPTGGWSKWSVSAATASLIAGSNKIKLTTNGSHGPNIDHLLTKAAGPLEAEQAVLSGAVVASNQTGYTGTGFVDYVNATGDFIEWTVNASEAGSFLLKFRYANGSTANRPLQLKVNGTTVAASLAFPPSGGWSTWTLSQSAAALVAGTNKIRLTTTGSNGPNIDHLSYGVNTIKHVLYMVDNGFNKLLFLNQKDPSKNWTISIPGGSRDLQLVANNKILVSHGNGAAEYDRITGAKGWSVSTYSGVSTAQRLANGNTLIGWSRAASGTEPAKIMLSEVNNAGAQVSRITINNITTFRLARRLANGNTLITGDMNNDAKYKVFEVNATGAIVWQQLLYGGKGYVANRLANGDTHATMGPVGNLYQPGKDDNKLLQLSPTGTIVKFWGGMVNHPAAELMKFSGYSVVPGNGNIIMANWLGDGNTGKGPHAVEFDANNSLIWSWKDFSAAQTITNLLVIE
jgi:hypothetical protein